jgi:N-acyl homoserine lactone hydrolase
MAHVTLEPLLTGNGINFQQGDLALSGVYLIRSTTDGITTNVVVDSGHVGMRRNLLEALVRVGLTPADVDIVALTHVHWDHVQNVDLFPQARVLLSAAELESVQQSTARDLVTPAWTRALLADADVLPVSPGDDVVEGLTILDAAGHTAGSLAFEVVVEGESHIIAGDALPWAEVGRLQKSALVFWDLERSQETIRRLVERADVLYPGHDRPFRLIDGRVEYVSEFDVTVFGIQPDTEGLHFGPAPILDTIDLTDGEPVGPRWTKEELRPR